MATIFYGGKQLRGQAFVAYRLDEDGTGNYFETSQSITDTWTLLLYCHPHALGSGIAHTVRYQLTPTNAETYTLFLGAYGAAEDLPQAMRMIYESATLRASGTRYAATNLDRAFELYTGGYIYYAVEWSGAPGNTTGYIYLTGECLQ